MRSAQRNSYLIFQEFFSETNILSVNDNGLHVPGFEMTHFKHKLMPEYGNEMFEGEEI
jgi:hypothetical protein